MNTFFSIRCFSLLLLLSCSYACGMQKGNSAQMQQLAQLVKQGNTTLQSIADSGSMSADHSTQLEQVTNDLTTGADDLESLITDIKTTIASNEKDPTTEKVFEDIGGCLLDVLKDAGPLALSIFEQIAAAKDPNHSVSRYHAAVQNLHTKVAQKR